MSWGISVLLCHEFNERGQEPEEQRGYQGERGDLLVGGSLGYWVTRTQEHEKALEISVLFVLLSKAFSPMWVLLRKAGSRWSCSGVLRAALSCGEGTAGLPSTPCQDSGSCPFPPWLWLVAVQELLLAVPHGAFPCRDGTWSFQPVFALWKLFYNWSHVTGLGSCGALLSRGTCRESL